MSDVLFKPYEQLNVPQYANVTISCTVTTPANVGYGTLLPAERPVQVERESATFTLSPCSAATGWCWHVIIRADGVIVLDRYVIVPASSTVLDFNDLQEVDPATLEPGTGTAAWTATLEAIRGELAATEAAVEATVADFPGITQGTVVANTGTTTTSNGNTANRWIIWRQLPSWTRVDSLEWYTRFPATNFVVELWRVEGANLKLANQKTFTNMDTAGAYVHQLDWSLDGSQYYLGFKTDTSSTVGSLTSTGAATEMRYTTDKTATTLAISGLTAASLMLYAKINVTNAYKQPGRGAGVLTVGKLGCDFTSIQAAIDNASDTAATPVAILVYPGTYRRFSMVGWPNQSGDWSKNTLRHLSIIGVAGRESTFVRDDTGDYRTPPAEIRTNGLIQGLTFYATHNDPFVDPTEEALIRRSYAVHMDFGVQDVTFRDCALLSNHAPGAGIGLHTGERITFDSCLLRSYADGSYGGLLDYGALFAHSGSGVATNQRIVLKNSEIYSAAGDRALWLSYIGAAGSSMTVEALRTLAYTYKAGATTHVVKSAGVGVTPNSWANSDAVLNAL